MEDLLTADTFGCFRYLPSEKALIPFLNTAKSFRGYTMELPGKIIGVHYSCLKFLSFPEKILYNY